MTDPGWPDENQVGESQVGENQVGENQVWLNGRRTDVSDPGAPRPARSAEARTLTVLSSAPLSTPVVLALMVVLIGDSGGFQPVPFVGGLVVGLLALILLPTLGYRIRPLPAGQAGTAAEAQAWQRFMSSVYVRLVLVELPALIAFALTIYQAPAGLINYLPGGVLALVAAIWHFLPNRWNVGRAEAALDRDGGRSNLLAKFGF